MSAGGPPSKQQPFAPWAVRTGVRWAGLSGVETFLAALRGLMGRGEVGLPKDLAHLGAVMAARGALNAQAFQASPDHLWPFWVNRQMDPRDPAYTPRGLNPLWFNQTHRNWTALGAPRDDLEAVVDPRGLLMVRPGSFSLDVAVRVGGVLHAPARLASGYTQHFDPDVPTVTGACEVGGVRIETVAMVDELRRVPLARLIVKADPGDVRDVELCVSVRPYNPEGVAPVFSVDVREDRVLVDGRPALMVRDPYDRAAARHFWEGDALSSAADGDARAAKCGAGLCTAAMFWTLDVARTVEVAAFVHADHGTPERCAKLVGELRGLPRGPSDGARTAWADRRTNAWEVRWPDDDVAALTAHTHTTLLLLDDGDAVNPGPFTYHQHWFRDSAYLVTALGRLGHREDARKKLVDYPKRQTRDGRYLSQDGEWDSNGQAIWTLAEHARLFDDDELLREQWPTIKKGARWLMKARTGARPDGHEGLLPAGLSAEHLGPHDWYLWDDLWGIAGLREAAWIARKLGHNEDASAFEAERQAFQNDLDLALARAEARLGRKAMPAAPGRGLDAGMIGNVAAVYPLQLLRADDARVVDTLDALEERCFLDDAFLQTMVHSGWNAYLTLQCAQVYLLAGRVDDAWRLARRVMALASPTGTWPEAVHPMTGGGCMGDGCHGWAAADWLLFVRNSLVVEHGEVLRLLAAPPAGWREHGVEVKNAPTRFGPVDLSVSRDGGRLLLQVEGTWHAPPDALVWRLDAPPTRVVVDGARLAPRGNSVHLPPDCREVRVSFEEVSAPTRLR